MVSKNQLKRERRAAAFAAMSPEQQIIEKLRLEVIKLKKKTEKRALKERENLVPVAGTPKKLVLQNTPTRLKPMTQAEINRNALNAERDRQKLLRRQADYIDQLDRKQMKLISALPANTPKASHKLQVVSQENRDTEREHALLMSSKAKSTPAYIVKNGIIVLTSDEWDSK